MMDTGDKNSTALNTFLPINRGCANLDTEGEIAKKKYMQSKVDLDWVSSPKVELYKQQELS